MTFTAAIPALNTVTDSATACSTLVQTLSELLGVDGVVSSGDESQTLDESSGNTVTEVDDGTETLSETQEGEYGPPVVTTTMTLTGTATSTDTDGEADEDWATETLGTSATIAGGSDCFTVDTLDASSYTSSGSGPENYNDTSGTPDGTATVNGSGSSSSLIYQEFGDVLGTGGAISSGSLSYTDSTSETDDQTTTESGTESVSAPIVDGGPKETGLYTITTSTPDDETAYETGTETLGEGGSIAGGSDSFSWSEGNSISRDLSITADGDVVDVTDTATDSFGFGESGTETITAGGGAAPGNVSFEWTQIGTDNYQAEQLVSESTVATSISSYSAETLGLADTVSYSWADDGVDDLSDNDSVVGESDAYTWAELDSATFGIPATLTGSYGYPGGGTSDGSSNETGMQSVSANDTGTDTLSADEADYGFMTLVAGTASYSSTETGTLGGPYDFTETLNGDGTTDVSGVLGYAGDESCEADFGEIGSLSQSGSTSLSSVYEWAGSSGNVSYDWDDSDTSGGLLSVGGGDASVNGDYSSDELQIHNSSESYVLFSISDGGNGFSTITSSISVSGSVYYSDYGFGGAPEYPSDSVTAEDDFDRSTSTAYGTEATGDFAGDISVSSYDLNPVSELDLRTGWESDGPPPVTFSWSPGSGTEPNWPEVSASETALIGVFLDPLSGDAIGPGDDLPTFELTFYPETDPMTPAGFPSQVLSNSYALNDGVSREAPPDPADVLIALAAPGRNPADIAIPVLAGSEASGTGSGAPDIRVASTQANGSGTSGAIGSGVLVAQGALEPTRRRGLGLWLRGFRDQQHGQRRRVRRRPDRRHVRLDVEFDIGRDIRCLDDQFVIEFLRNQRSERGGGCGEHQRRDRFVDNHGQRRRKFVRSVHSEPR